MGGGQVLIVSTLLSVPQYLPCGQDNATMMDFGQTIMGIPVGARGAGTLRVAAFREAGNTSLAAEVFVPGDRLIGLTRNMSSVARTIIVAFVCGTGM